MEKGEERHKKNQAVSPCRILFGKGRREWKRWITQVFEQRTFLERESFEQKLLERWREDEIEKSVERDERKYWKVDWKRWVRSMNNVSCQAHIFIISWWLKSKLVALGNSFKTSYLKSYDFWKNLQKQVTWRIVTFGN